jgi:hypothetical protein
MRFMFSALCARQEEPVHRVCGYRRFMDMTKIHEAVVKWPGACISKSKLKSRPASSHMIISNIGDKHVKIRRGRSTLYSEMS